MSAPALSVCTHIVALSLKLLATQIIYAADGLAEVIKHRSEEDRASNYDELLAAGMDGMV
jgi:hypothetical protein